MMLAAGELQTADHFVLIAYFVVMLGIGAYFFRFMRRMRDYFSGGTKIPWWLSGASFYMSSFSVFGFVVNSALVYRFGWVGITMFWCYIPGTLLCTFVFAKRWRRARIDSPIEYMEARYSPTMRQLCAWHGIPMKIGDDALKLVSIGIFLSASLGFGIKESMLWSGLIMLAYTFMGGLWAVVVTDFVQFVVMGAAVIVLFVLSMIKAGGPSEFVANVPEGAFSLVHAEYGWIYIICMVFLYVVSMSSVHWQLIQRFCCVPDERETRKMGLMVVVLQFITPVIMFLPAMAARQFMGGEIEAEQIYPQLCVNLLPTGLLGLMIAAMFAATMSMLSSDYNACANVLTNDVYRRLIRPEASQRELVLVGRIATLALGVLALGIAFLIIERNGEGLFRAMVSLFSVATPPVAIPMIMGLISKRMSAVSALAGFCMGLALGLGLFFTLPDTVSLGDLIIKKENLLLFGTAITSGLVMYLVSRLIPAGCEERERTKPFLDRLDVAIGGIAGDPGTEDEGQEAGAFSPFKIVGVSVVAVGVIMLAVSPIVEGTVETLLNVGIGVALVLGGAITVLCVRKSVSRDPVTQEQQGA